MKRVKEASIGGDVQKELAGPKPEDSRSNAFDLGAPLPAEALLLESVGASDPIPAGATVQIIYAETGEDSNVLVRFIYEGRQGICELAQIAIASNEAVASASEIDLRRLALGLLETAKRMLATDNYLIPLAFIVTSGNMILVPLSFNGIEEKKSAYARLIKLAKAHRALALVTVNDAYLSGPDDNIEDYYQGKLAESRAAEGIWVTVSGPAMANWSITSQYTRMGGEIVFRSDVESSGGEINLLDGWSSSKPVLKS